MQNHWRYKDNAMSACSTALQCTEFFCRKTSSYKTETTIIYIIYIDFQIDTTDL